MSVSVSESSVMQAVADPQYLFATINEILKAAGNLPLFEVELVGIKRVVKLNSGMFSMHRDKQLKVVKKTDLIFIPALFGDMEVAVAKNRAAVPWIIEQYIW